MACCCPISLLNSVDLPTFGRPTMANVMLINFDQS
jgi:hypothetical protein